MRDTALHNKHNDFYIIGDIHWRGVKDSGIPNERIAFETDAKNINTLAKAPTTWTHL